MKKSIIIILLVLVVIVIGLLITRNNEYESPTPTNTEIIWTGSKPMGTSHTGTISIKENNLVFKKGELKGGSVIFDMNSIQNSNLEGDRKKRLEDHLKNEDFFETNNYPTSTFEIIDVQKNGDQYNVSGKLTIKDITHEEAFVVNATETDEGCQYRASIAIDRTKYDVVYKSASILSSLGDQAIRDKFQLDVAFIIEK